MAKKSSIRKYFVLDTNVVLYDYRSIYSFEDNNVVLPITLLEELDKFKKGNEIINLNAREFNRELDALIGERLLNEKVQLKTGGYIMVDTNTRMSPELKDVFWEDKPDHRILSVAYNLSKKMPEEKVILVTKDINLRMKAKSFGIIAEDYETGKVKDISELYTGKDMIEHVQSEVIDKIYEKGQLTLEEAGMDVQPLPNEYFIVRNGYKSLLCCYDKSTNSMKLVEKRKAYGIQPRNSEQTFSLHALMNPNVSLVTLSGKAGTGKTLMALAAALEIRKQYQQIFLARPIVPLSNKDIGYLPGDVKSKLDPYMQPLYDNLSVIKHQFKEESPDFNKIAELLANEKLMITPLA